MSWLLGNNHNHRNLSGNISFGKNSKMLSVNDLIKLLYPKTTHFDRHIETNGTSTSRFSQLLLEHGEKRLQDWAVVAFSTPIDPSAVSSPPNNIDDAALYTNQSSNKKGDNDNSIQWVQSPLKVGPKKAVLSNDHKCKGHANIQKMDKDMYPTAHMTKLEGRVHLCSGSIVFEPNDSSRGIVRCPFNKMDGPPVEHPNEVGFESMCIEYTARRHVVMKHNNTIGPYTTVTVPCRFRLTFLHSSPSTFIDICLKLYTIATTTNKNHRQSNINPELEALMKPMLDRPFDPRNLVDAREQILTISLRCAITTPLQSRPGTMVLTSERIYFQPAVGMALITATTTDTFSITTSADSWLQRNVVALARRYYGLRDSAIELYWNDETSTLFSFERRHDRELVVQYLNNIAIPCLTDREFVVNVVQEWQTNNVSNFEYILALNCAAGRSFHDLSRYPVFPWVIADYESTKLDLTKESTFRDLSKPIGALNEDRLQYFQTRLKGMQDMDEAFLYGTHYSAPGYVLYFLIRSMPEHMLCLQNGKFDAPDRIFDSVAQCYNSVLTNHADVKELIPEFYNDGKDFDFLINVKGLQLGATQNGDRVNDVKLPPWSRSARDFIKKNRKALESEITTRALPRWLDLIFGCKSRGEGAVEANNIFHHNAYLGPSDLAGMKTDEERFQAELQATEFGIVPDMLFRSEHPHKSDPMDLDFILSDIGRSSSKDESGRDAWELLDAPTHDQSSMAPVEANPIDDESYAEASSRFETGTKQHWHNAAASALSNYSELIQTPVQNVPLRGTGETRRYDRTDELQGSSNPPRSTRNEATSNLINVDSPKVQLVIDGQNESSEWDIQIIERINIHGDAVSGCALYLNDDTNNLSILVTTSLDGGLIAHKIALDAASGDQIDTSGFISPFTRFSYNSLISRSGQATQSSNQSKLTEYRSHTSRDPLASLVVASDGAGGIVAFAGGHDDIILAYGIKSACAVASVYSHRDAITGLDLITRTPFDSDSTLWLENSTHILVSGSWDATVKVWSASVASGEAVAINREPLAELFDADSSIICVSAHSIPLEGILIAAGCADGCFCVWTVHIDGVQVLLYSESARKGNGQCSTVKCAVIGGIVHVFAAFSNGRLASYTMVDNTLRQESVVSLGVAITSLFHADGVLLVGCADGGFLLVPISKNAHFERKPTVWKALNNTTTSPGITSVSQAVIRDRCICCTGGVDGSVVLFELKRIFSH
jgi:factor associated with neutral sphingomyelinase activation